MRAFLAVLTRFAAKIRLLYGDEFFTYWLHIPREEINLFLDYCQANNLSEYIDSAEFIIKDFLIKQGKKYKLIKN